MYVKSQISVLINFQLSKTVPLNWFIHLYPCSPKTPAFSINYSHFSLLSLVMKQRSLKGTHSSCTFKNSQWTEIQKLPKIPRNRNIPGTVTLNSELQPIISGSHCLRKRTLQTWPSPLFRLRLLDTLPLSLDSFLTDSIPHCQMDPLTQGLRTHFQRMCFCNATFIWYLIYW